MSNAAVILCPYCGHRQPVAPSCGACSGLFDPWSVAATQNDMGAWFVRDAKRPHFVGYSYDAVVAAIKAGEIGRDTILRGPSTRQLWTVARRAAGLAHLFGRCHACQGPVVADSPSCAACAATPFCCSERNYFGLPPVERFAPPAAPQPLEAMLAAGFVREGQVYFVRAAPVPPPTETIVRVAAPVIEEPEPVPAPPPPPMALALADARSAPAPAPDPAPRAFSAIDRSLAERVRHLERTNRALFIATVFTAVLALLLAGAYVVQRDARDKELTAAREEAVRKLRTDFERTQPLTSRKAPELPPEPEPPATRAQPPARPATPR